MLTGSQYAELATEMMMNRVPTWDSETAYGWVRRNLPGYQAWEDGGQVDGGWSDLVGLKMLQFKNTIYQLLVEMPLKLQNILDILNKMVHQLVLITSKYLEHFHTPEKLVK